MHKARSHRRTHHHPPKPKKPPKTNWNRYKLPVFILGAAILIGAAGIHLRSRATPEPIPAERIESIGHRPGIKVRLLDGSIYHMSGDEIEHVIETDCCRIIIIPGSSKVMGIISGQGEDDTSYGFTAGIFRRDETSSGQGLALVRDADAPRYGESLSEQFILDLNESHRDIFLRIAKTGTIDERREIVAQIVREVPLLDSSAFLIGYTQIQEEELGKAFIRGAAETALVSKAILGRVGSMEHTKRSRFINMVIHEAIHAAQMKYEDGVEAELINSEEERERFANIGAIAYGNDPLVQLEHILGNARIAYIGRSFPNKNQNPIIDSGREGSSEMYLRILNAMLDEMGLSDILMLPDQDPQRLRDAALRILDHESMRIFQRSFAEVVPLGELSQIRASAAEYYDTEMGR